MGHGMVRWGSPETPSQFIYDGNNMRKETVAEYLKRGGKVDNLPYVKDSNIDYFTGGKNKPKNGARLDLAELVGTSSYDNRL